MKSVVNKRWRFLTAFVVLLTVMAFVLVACGGNQMSSGGSGTTTPASTATPTPRAVPHFKVGEVAKITGWEITIGGSNTDGVKMVQAGAYAEHKADLEIGVEMTNASYDTQNVTMANWQLIDLSGKSYTDNFGMDASCTSSSTGDFTVPGGATINGWDKTDGTLNYCPIPDSVHQFQLLFSAKQNEADAIWDITVREGSNESWPPLANEDIRQYLNIPNLQTGDLSNPYIKGKIVVIDKNVPEGQYKTSMVKDDYDRDVLNDICLSEGFNGGCYAQAPVGGNEKLIANNPTEVGTIVWIDCVESDTGERYTPGGGIAYSTTCTTTIIDKAKSLIVGKASFGPIHPPAGITCYGGSTCPGYGPMPDKDIAKYLLSLPRE